LLLIRIDRWKSDAYFAMDLDFDLEATLLDASGNVLGRSMEHGREAIGGSGRSANAGAVQALEAKLELLLNSPKIQQALQGAPATGAGAP
jgi:hypothetical protein